MSTSKIIQPGETNHPGMSTSRYRWLEKRIQSCKAINDCLRQIIRSQGPGAKEAPAWMVWYSYEIIRCIIERDKIVEKKVLVP